MALLVPALLAAVPPPPSVIAPYVHGGRFEPGDYRWLRGSFDGASAAEIAAYEEMVKWRSRCRASDMEETRSELKDLGIRAGEAIEAIPYRSLVCDQVATVPEPLDLHDWSGFVRDVSLVRSISLGFLNAVSMGEKASAADSTDLRDALNARAVGEQALRAGIAWMNGSPGADGRTSTLTPQQRGILTSEFAMALAVRDHSNTAWLKKVVLSQGWPKRSQVGEGAARTAWLLVQHADADPAFQVQALRLIEPLVSTGEATPRNYAYLYDRVMLKLVGRQRYGTQLNCQNGRLHRWRWRARSGWTPGVMRRAWGPCRPISRRQGWKQGPAPTDDYQYKVHRDSCQSDGMA